MATLEVGSIGPDFALPDQEGNYIKLNRVVESSNATVVYFFPQADTPGCTKEACGFRDSMGELAARKISVLGISADKQPDQSAFARKNDLNFSVLADTDHSVCEEWGAWRGAGVGRTTFVLDGKGIITHIFPRVDVSKHAADILALFADAPAAVPVASDGGGAVAAAAGGAVAAPAASSDVVASVARGALQLLLAQLDAGAALPADVAELAARVAARR
jgi:peroxiredoxin Q/BCP